MRPPAGWVLPSALGVAALLAAPAVRETLRPPAAREAWRRDFLVLRAEDVGRMMARGDRKIVLVDVREPEEYAQCRIPHARPVPLRRVADMDLSDCMDADLVIPYCYKDLRGFEGARILRRRGVPHVALFEGFGLNAWEAARLPLAGTAGGMDDATAASDLLELLDVHRSALEGPP